MSISQPRRLGIFWSTSVDDEGVGPRAGNHDDAPRDFRQLEQDLFHGPHRLSKGAYGRLKGEYVLPGRKMEETRASPRRRRA